MSPLSHKQLFERVLRAVDESGWQALVHTSRKPFRLRLFRGDEKGFDVRIYLWNCTHGGGAARANDEYRVQLTGVAPSEAIGEVTLLLAVRVKLVAASVMLLIVYLWCCRIVVVRWRPGCLVQG